MTSRFSQVLDDLRSRHLHRALRRIDAVSGPEIIIHQDLADLDADEATASRRLINFSSNNYLGLADHPQLKQAAIAATEKWGTGAGASRLITGNFTLHEELEQATAAFKGTTAAVVFNSGYQANTTILPALTGTDDVIFSDALNHASLIDGCRLSRARTLVFPHSDVQALRIQLQRESRSRAPRAEFFIVVDGIFSMDGDVAPLKDLLALAQEFDAHIVVDEAHSTGVMGATGRGLVEHFGITTGRERLILMGTFSKALGSFGAYVAGERELVHFLINQARGFIYTTALPPGVIAASRAALQVVVAEPERLKRLHENVELLRQGLELAPSDSPILPLILGDEGRTLELAEKLFAAGFWCHPIRPPTVPKGSSRIRLTVTAGHEKKHIQGLLDQLSKF